MDNQPLFFIYQSGFQQISLPPLKDKFLNRDILNLTSCDDEVLVTTDIPLEDAVSKIKPFIGRKIVCIYCDTNEVREEGMLIDASLAKGNYGEEVIYLQF